MPGSSHRYLGEGKLGKEPHTAWGTLAPPRLGSEAGLECVCKQSVPHFSHLENGRNINKDFIKLLS